MAEHNHLTRDIKSPGKCPACDTYHARHPKPPELDVPEPYVGHVDSFAAAIGLEVNGMPWPGDLRG